VAKKAVTPIRTIRAYFIKARRESALQQQAGYTEAILSLSSTAQRLAKWEETIYGLILRYLASACEKRSDAVVGQEISLLSVVVQYIVVGSVFKLYSGEFSDACFIEQVEGAVGGLLVG
jgi:hypothetical protein